MTERQQISPTGAQEVPGAAQGAELRVEYPSEILDGRNDSGAWLEAAISEWYTGVSRELVGALQQMRAAAYAKAKAGRDGVEELARSVNAKKSKVYAYSECFEILADTFGDHVSVRLESSPLSPWQLVESCKTGEFVGDVPGTLDRAEERGLTTRELRAERQEDDRSVNLVTVARCPDCGHVGPMRDFGTWEAKADG